MQHGFASTTLNFELVSVKLGAEPSPCRQLKAHLVDVDVSGFDGSFDALDEVVYLKWLSEQACRARRRLGLEIRV